MAIPVSNAPTVHVPVANVNSGGSTPNLWGGSWEPLYDWATFSGGVQVASAYEFFADGHDTNRGYAQTNVPEPRSLPGYETFSVYGIGLSVLSNEEDVIRHFQRSLVELCTGDTVVWRNPQISVGSVGGVSGVGVAGSPILNAGAGVPFMWPVIPVLDSNGVPTNQLTDFRVPLLAEQAFEVRVTFQTLFTPTEDTEVCAFLIGQRIKPVDQ